MSKIIFKLRSLSEQEAVYRADDKYSGDLIFQKNDLPDSQKITLFYYNFSVVGDSREECLDKLRNKMAQHLDRINASVLGDEVENFK